MSLASRRSLATTRDSEDGRRSWSQRIFRPSVEYSVDDVRRESIDGRRSWSQRIFRPSRDYSVDGRRPSPRATIHRPTEILDLVFQHLSPANANHANTLRDLRSASLVSKAWHTRANELLYRDALIRSPSKLRLFLRTLIAQPGLGTLVRSIVVLHAPLTRPRMHSFSSLVGRCRKFQKTLARAMKACPKLHELGVSYREGPHSISTCLMELTLYLPHQLRRLHLRGGHTTFRTPYLIPLIEYPNLEELSLECFIFDRILQWPSLPALQRLRLLACHCLYQGSLIPARLPSLRSIELIGTGTHSIDGNHIKALYEYAHVLESLAVMGCCWVAQPTTLDISRFVKLKHLFLDLSALMRPLKPLRSSTQPVLVMDHLPPHLVSMTIVMALRVDAPEIHSQAMADTQEHILWSLMNIANRGRQAFPSLKHLYLEGLSKIWQPVAASLTSSFALSHVKARFSLFDEHTSSPNEINGMRSHVVPWRLPGFITVHWHHDSVTRLFDG